MSGLIGLQVKLRGHIMPHSSSFVFRKQILNFFPGRSDLRGLAAAAFARICYFFGLVENMMLTCDTSPFRPIESCYDPSNIQGVESMLSMLSYGRWVPHSQSLPKIMKNEFSSSHSLKIFYFLFFIINPE